VVDPLEPGSTRFRGWWILAFCTLSIALTTPGQTIGVSAFVERLTDDLNLTDTSVSTAYLIGTLAGSTTMASIGRWIDRRGVRHTMLIIAVVFPLVVMSMSLVQNIVMLTIGFVGIRMMGQGSLSLVSQTGIALWFERWRGLAFGISMTVSAALMAAGPFVLTRVIDAVGWRWAWIAAGATVFMILVPGTWFLMVDRPESIGQQPDGSSPHEKVVVPDSVHYTVREAMRTGAFWALTATMVASSALITGLTFHHFAMMEARGLTDEQAATVFLPQMIGTIGAGFVFAFLTDRVSSRPLLGLSMVALAVALVSYSWVEPGLGAWVFGLLVGLNAGSIRALSSALYPKWFGTRNIGAIRGVATQFGVAASAIGPLAVAVGLDLAGSYSQLLTLLVVAPVAAGLGSLMVAEPAARPLSPTSTSLK
jgi:MFS family permease